MRILFITLLLVGCPDKDDPQNIDPESTTSPSPDTTQQPSPTNTQTKTTPPPKLPDPTFPQPPQTGFALHVFGYGTKEGLPDILQIAVEGGALVLTADPTRYNDDVKFLLYGCARPGVKLFTQDINLDDGSAPYELEGKVGDTEYFSVIDTSGAKDAVTGCVLRANVISSNGVVTSIEKPVTVRAGKLRLSNPTLTAAGEVSVTIEAESGTSKAYVNLTRVFRVETGGYRLMAISNDDDDDLITPNTPYDFSIDTGVIDWGQEEQKEEGVLEAGTYFIFLSVDDRQGNKYRAKGGIEVSL